MKAEDFVKREYNGVTSIEAPFVGTLLSVGNVRTNPNTGNDFRLVTIEDFDGESRTAVTSLEEKELVIGKKYDCRIVFVSGDKVAKFRLLWPEGGRQATTDDYSWYSEKLFQTAPTEVVEA